MSCQNNTKKIKMFCYEFLWLYKKIMNTNLPRGLNNTKFLPSSWDKPAQAWHRFPYSQMVPKQGGEETNLSNIHEHLF
jgi:hypothetical protein